MDEAVIRKSVADLNKAITSVPLASVQRTAGGIYQSDNLNEQSLEASLDQLRLQVKYLLFDLEATRRENRYLRQLLENRPDPRRGQIDDNSDF